MAERQIIYTEKEVREMQKRPYETQINIAVSKMLEACVKSNFKIFVAFSGGKDSTALLYIMAQVWKSLENQHNNKPLEVVFNNTTIEYCGMGKWVREYVEFIQNKFEIKINFHESLPKNHMNFVKVYRERGIPMISKTLAKSISTMRRLMKQFSVSYEEITFHLEKTLENVDWFNKHFGGMHSPALHILGYTFAVKKFGSEYKIPDKWIPLLNLDYDIELTDECCAILKHSNIPEELKGYSVMTAEMAEESRIRMKAYQQTGCNLFVNGVGKSKPFGPITLQTELRYIKDNKIPLFKYYGTVEEYEKGQYRTTGMYRTGCALCGFGIEFEPDRFEKLYNIEPARVRFAFKSKAEGGLGYKEFFEYCNKYCGTKWVIPKGV